MANQECSPRDDGSNSTTASACGAEDQDYHFPVVIVGAGPAGIGVAHAMLKANLTPPNMLLVERGEDVGSSFRQWHSTTRFISPSFASYPYGPQDLNAIIPDTSVNASSNGGQHPTGMEYAEYLERMMEGTEMLVELENSITKVEHKVGQGHNGNDIIVLYTSNGNIILCDHLVWAVGDWSNPTQLPSSTFAEDASVHYKHANLDELVKSVENTDDPIVLVGSGEAGADLASALVGKGASKILILEKQLPDDDPSLDPSRRLSPITQDRLARIADHVETKCGAQVIGVKRDGKKNKVQVKHANGETSTYETLARVVLCTGFDVSTSELWKSMFHFTNGSPLVNEFDESTKMPNVFLAGPMLYHKTTSTCEPKDADDPDDDQVWKHESELLSDAETSDEVGEEPACNDDDTIIFCFVYKFRTRFPVVAGEIVRRIARAKFASQKGMHLEDVEHMIQDVEKMQQFYRAKGMMVDDLSCSNLACGMSDDDRPRYPYQLEARNEDEEE